MIGGRPGLFNGTQGTPLCGIDEQVELPRFLAHFHRFIPRGWGRTHEKQQSDRGKLPGAVAGRVGSGVCNNFAGFLLR